MNTLNPLAPATDAVALRAAEAAATLVPSSAPLAVRPALVSEVPAGATAYVATLVGAPSADVVLVVSDVLADVEAAAAATGGTVTAHDAVRPALEAAAREVGTGVLDESRSQDASAALAAADVFALTLDGTTVGWFGLRLREQPAPHGTPARPGTLPTPRGTMRMLYDVEMTLTVEIGRTSLPVRQVLDLTPGTVLDLDRAAGGPADLMVNGRLIARGEIVVVDESYGIRVTQIVADEDATR